MSNNYDRNKFPPAPVLDIRFSAPREPAEAQVYPALIDTGSDFTLVPLDMLKQIDAPESRPAQVRGLWSDPHEITLYIVDIHLENGVLPSVEVIGTENSSDIEIILGRNILNRLILLLDGRGLQTEVLERRPVRF
jgi:predicted aspartyl protease